MSAKYNEEFLCELARKKSVEMSDLDFFAYRAWLETSCGSIDEERVYRIANELDAAKTPCTWTQQDEWESNNWGSSCGDVFFFEDWTPEENDVKFCPFCGHPVVQKLYEPEPDEEE